MRDRLPRQHRPEGLGPTLLGDPFATLVGAITDPFPRLPFLIDDDTLDLNCAVRIACIVGETTFVTVVAFVLRLEEFAERGTSIFGCELLLLCRCLHPW